jgi:hypothetical protein
MKKWPLAADRCRRIREKLLIMEACVADIDGKRSPSLRKIRSRE